MRKIVLATIGSLGDLHPFIAIGLALQARGFAVVLAVPADHVAKVEAAGLTGVAIVGGFDTLAKALGLPPEQAARRIMADQTYLMDRILMPWLADSTTALDEAMDGAVALVASLFVFAAPIVAELRGVPLVNVLLQPMATFSAYAPPSTPDFRMMAPAPAGPVGRAWNRAVYRVMRGVLRHRHARPVNAVRAAHGLPPSAQALLLETPAATALTLCCYSPLIAPSQPDLPATMRITGFAVFDSDPARPRGSIRRWMRSSPRDRRRWCSRWDRSPRLRRAISTRRRQRQPRRSACERSCSPATTRRRFRPRWFTSAAMRRTRCCFHARARSSIMAAPARPARRCVRENPNSSCRIWATSTTMRVGSRGWVSAGRCRRASSRRRARGPRSLRS